MNLLIKHFAATFFAVVVSGVASIMFFVGQVEHQSATFALLGLMGFFAFVIWKKKHSPFAGETDGDSFYYLGFIFTLATLVAAFLPSLNSKDQLSEQQIVNYFGLGLITTFVGLVGRILFTHYRPTSRHTVEESMGTLGVAIRTLSSEILVVAQQIGSYSQSVTTQIAAVSEEANSSLRKHSELFGTSIAASLKTIDSSLEELAAGTRNIISENTKITIATLASFREELTECKTSLSDFNKFIVESSKKTQGQLGRWNKAFDDQTAQLLLNTGAYSELTKAIKEPMEQSTAVLNSIRENLDGLNQNIYKFDLAIEEMNKVSAVAVDIQGEFVKSITTVRTTHDALLLKMRNDQEMITRHTKGLEEALRESDEAVLKVYKHMAESAEVVVERIKAGDANSRI